MPWGAGLYTGGGGGRTGFLAGCVTSSLPTGKTHDHWDIELENILVYATGNSKLCDFGMATKLIDGQMLGKGCGSLFYLALESLEKIHVMAVLSTCGA